MPLRRAHRPRLLAALAAVALATSACTGLEDLFQAGGGGGDPEGSADTTVPTSPTGEGSAGSDTTEATGPTVPVETTQPAETSPPGDATPGTTADCDGTRPAGNDGTGFFVDGPTIHDPAGCPFVPMGFNAAVFWNVTGSDGQSSHEAQHRASFAHQRAVGANSVRIVTQTGGSFGWNADPATQRELVELAVEQDLVPILEMHDATCDASIDAIPTYWTSPEMVQLANDHEDTLWINLANEHNFASPEAWLDGYTTMIGQLRAAGIRNPIMIDSAANCGQSPEAILRYGRDLLEADPQHNVIFSFHLYSFWRTGPATGQGFTPPNEVTAVFQDLADTGLAIHIGEFGWDQPATDLVTYDPRVVLEQTLAHGFGWSFWSWYEDNPAFRAVSDIADTTPLDALSPAGTALSEHLAANASPASTLG